MKPSFSIIIPARNEEKFIRRCIDSIKSVKHKGMLEIIVVDNSSTDNTSKIAGSTGVKVYKEERVGVSYARNLGADKAKNDYLVFLDADCMLTKFFFYYLTKIIRNNREQDIFAGPYEIYDGGRFIRYITGKLNYYYWFFRFIKLITGVQSFSGGNFVIKKEVFNKTYGFNTKIDSILKAEDLEYALRLNSLGYKVYFDKDLKVFSSFRRVRKSPIYTAIVRSYYSIKLIGKYKLTSKEKLYLLEFFNSN